MRLARRFSVVCRETNRNLDWNGLLRHGIRGGTERDMLHNLCYGSGTKGVILQPTRNGLRDRADYWLSCTNRQRKRLLKKSIASVFRVLDHTLKIIPTPNVDVVIRKTA